MWSDHFYIQPFEHDAFSEPLYTVCWNSGEQVEKCGAFFSKEHATAWIELYWDKALNEQLDKILLEE